MTYRSDFCGTFKSFIELGSHNTEPVLTLARSPSQVISFQLTLPSTSGNTDNFLVTTAPGIFDFYPPATAINKLLPGQSGNQDKALLTDGADIYWGTVATNNDPLTFTFSNQSLVQYTHNLGRYVGYLILDSNNYAIGGEASQTLNAITINFNSAISGTLLVW